MFSAYKLQSKLLEGSYIGDGIGEYYRAIRGILGVEIISDYSS